MIVLLFYLDDESRLTNLNGHASKNSCRLKRQQQTVVFFLIAVPLASLHAALLDTNHVRPFRTAHYTLCLVFQRNAIRLDSFPRHTSTRSALLKTASLLHCRRAVQPDILYESFDLN